MTKEGETVSEHTKEPWKVSEYRPKNVLDSDGYGIVAEIQVARREDGEQEANARRIALCVNACAGKTNEQLEGAAGKLFTGSAIALWSNYCDLKEKNAALSEQVAGLVGAIDIWQENPTTGNGFALIDAAAIAKAGSHD